MTAMEGASSSALILARPDSLREGLAALLKAVPVIRDVYLADGLPQVTGLGSAAAPLRLLLVDAGLLEGHLPADLAHLSEMYPEAACILLTDSREQEEAATRAGAQAVLRKGILADQLLGHINEWLSRATG